MSDLISREDLIEEFKARCICNCDRCKYQQGIHCGLIDNAPTVEPTFGLFKEMLCSECEKRPHGKWLVTETFPHKVYGQCSICKQRKRIDNYCPNCGADMRGGATND